MPDVSGSPFDWPQQPSQPFVAVPPEATREMERLRDALEMIADETSDEWACRYAREILAAELNR